jgi:transcriptional regulator with XRE-family HTH domain
MTEDERRQQLSQWLCRNLNEHGLTGKQVAEMVGCTAPTVSAWCRGRQSPHPRNLARLEELFGERFSGSEKPTPVVLQNRWCEACEHEKECMMRALAGWPVLCERLSLDDLLVARHRGVLNEWVWWREVDVGKGVEELANELQASMVDW